MNRRLAILGCRGIPARHGGFETFAEKLAPYMAARGWDVTVYCQTSSGDTITKTTWNGVTQVNIPEKRSGPLATIWFDLQSILHASRKEQLILTLGYNTALFCVLHRVRGLRNIINMDGLEWKRAKWSLPVRAWFYVNERIGCWVGHHLIADHPDIEAHLASRVGDTKRITMIPYGADRITNTDSGLLTPLGLAANEYALIVGRPQQDNSTLEMVSAFSRRTRGINLAVLCPYDPEHNPYDRRVMDVASPEVKFLGGIYDRPTIQALQFFSRLYMHGHQVGGTNPSLLEALGSGSAILAHDNRFNRWVAGRAARYFCSENDCALQLDVLLQHKSMLDDLRSASRAQLVDKFKWETVLAAYETLLERQIEAERVS